MEVIGIILTSQIETKWNNNNVAHYKEKGYFFTKFGDTFVVDIKDLPNKSAAKIQVQCDCCKTIYIRKYSNVQNSINRFGNYYCQYCMHKRNLFAKRQKYYKKIINYCNQYNYTLISSVDDIQNVESIIEYICPLHGSQTTKLKNILANKQCFSCGRKNALQHKSETTLKQRQENLFNRALIVANKKKYTILSKQEDIRRNTSLITYSCSNPLHSSHTMRIANFINGKGCPDCALEESSFHYSLPIEEAKKRVEMYGGHILNWNDYRNYNVRNLQVVCSDCGNVFITSARNFCQRQGQICTVCSLSESKAERKIKKLLQTHNIVFEQEKRFEDCKDIKPLPFDFYIPDWRVCIEYDGEQHFKDRCYKNGTYKDSLDYTQSHDKIKTQYCSNNNLFLLRIPYWDEANIESIILKLISNYTKI